MMVQVTITPNGRMSLLAEIRKRLGLVGRSTDHVRVDGPMRRGHRTLRVRQMGSPVEAQ